MTRLSGERGQAMVMTVIFTTVLLGCVTLTLDVGSWYREQRAAQATADAAALAGAQALPQDPSQATTLAQTYADDNGSGVPADGITIRSDFNPNDTVAVSVRRTAPGFFSKLFGIDSATVHATAAARAGVPIAVEGAAPIVVSEQNPMLSGPGCPCFHAETSLPLSDVGAPGGFGLINLAPDQQNVGETDVANWVQYGLDAELGLGTYQQETGTKFNGNAITNALTARTGTELLFPVFDSLTAQGTKAYYNIIGWVAFHLDSFEKKSGSKWTLNGHFTQVIWKGIQSRSNPHLPDWGVHTIALVN